MVGTPMKGNLAKRIWPIFVASKVRTWVLENVQGGDVTRVEIAANAPMPTLKEGGPPIPDDGLSVEVDISNATRRVRSTACRRSATPISTTRIKGRNVVVNVDRGVVELESGRKLTVSNGVFEVPDTRSEIAAGARAPEGRRTGRGRGRTCGARPPARTPPARRSIRRPAAAMSSARSRSACRS